MINLSLQKGIQKGEKVQKTYASVNLTSALGKMKALVVIKAISKYLHIWNKIKIKGFFQKKKKSPSVAELLGFHKTVLARVLSLQGKGIWSF